MVHVLVVLLVHKLVIVQMLILFVVVLYNLVARYFS